MYVARIYFLIVSYIFIHCVCTCYFIFSGKVYHPGIAITGYTYTTIWVHYRNGWKYTLYGMYTWYCMLLRAITVYLQGVTCHCCCMRTRGLPTIHGKVYYVCSVCNDLNDICYPCKHYVR